MGNRGQGEGETGREGEIRAFRFLASGKADRILSDFQSPVFGLQSSIPPMRISRNQKGFLNRKDTKHAKLLNFYPLRTLRLCGDFFYSLYKESTGKYLLLAIVLLAFVLRVYHLNAQSLWRDEVDAIRYSGGTFRYLLSILSQKGHNGPLYFVVLRLWRALTGDSEFALRYFSTVGGVLMVALSYQTARALRFTRAAGVIAALLAAGSPYLIWYSQEAKMYTWLATLVLLAAYAFQRALTQSTDRHRWTQIKIIKNLCPSVSICGRFFSAFWWAIFVVATSLSFYTHILAPLMLPVYALWALVQWTQFKAHWKGWLVSMLLLTLPYLPLLRWQAPLLMAESRTGHPFYPLPEMARLLAHFYSAGILNSGYSLYLMTGFTFLLLAGLFFPLPKAPARSRLQLAIWLLLPPLSVYLISLRVRVFEDRYLIYIAPAFYLLAALGLAALFTRRRWPGYAALSVLMAFNLWGAHRQANNPVKADFRAAAAYILTADPSTSLRTGPLTSLRTGRQPPTISSQSPISNTQPSFYSHRIYLPFVARSPARPTVMIQMPYLQYTFDYYYPQPYHLLEGVWTNDNRPEIEVDWEMKSKLGGVPQLWLVVAEEDYWDNRHLTRNWLNKNAVLVDEAHFTGVDVYNYQLAISNEQ